ncbi:unnamed protein product, partial [Rotaria magnacalcarata]
PNVLEQEKRMLNLINQYSSTSSAATTTLLLHDSNEFPSLPNMYQRQQGLLHNDILDELINLLTSKMEKIIEETTKRLFKSLQQKIKKIEETISSVETLINDDATSSSSFSDNDEDVQIKQINKPTTTSAATTAKPTTTTTSAETTAKPTTTTNATSILSSITTNDSIKKPTPKPKAKARTSKRIRSLDSSLESTIMDPKDRKTDTINDYQPLISFITNVETHPTIGTINGHKPLTFDIQIGAEPKPTSPRLSLNFKEAKWTKFRSKLDQQLMLWNNDTSLNAALNIEEHLMFITNSIMLATKEAVPTPTPTSKIYPLSEASKSLITLKHQAYRRWKRTGDNIDKRQYYNSKILLTNSLRNDRRDNLNKLMSSLCHKKMYSDKVWLTVRKFHSKRIKQTFTCNMTYNDTTATSDKEKADLFADYFENDVYSYTDDTLPFHDQVTSPASNIKKKSITSLNTPKWKQITIEEVKYHIKQLRNGSAGPDNIHNRCLKNSSELLIQHLTKLFNQILKQGYIPTKWKTANIILILKPKKDKQHPSSYRKGETADLK